MADMTIADRLALRWEVARVEIADCDGDGDCSGVTLPTAPLAHSPSAHLAPLVGVAMQMATHIYDNSDEDYKLDFDEISRWFVLTFPDGSALGVSNTCESVEVYADSPFPVGDPTQRAPDVSTEKTVAALTDAHEKTIAALRSGEPHAAQASAWLYSSIAAESAYIEPETEPE